ncbi:hypothetical protein CAPGI0001_2292 [Capnocytophaga gingivalis ATCC 33624]|uniref:hypothetical protein n=1 Tax=Capnocytophaga gingivalis TaxID=1017 RepID=UPI00019FA9C4|nr:hypothetical protein [Capnocytophaga gingivalis]EEK14299.1 hypothetical protein CAPGI0001_2292 [Capnocytophaga gingivalis ATCC 33624]
MKHILIIVVSFLIGSTFVNAQYKKSDMERFNIKGHYPNSVPFKDFYSTIEGTIPHIPSPYNIINAQGIGYRAQVKDGFPYEFDENGNVKYCGYANKGAKMTYEGTNEIRRITSDEYGDAIIEFKYNDKGIIIGKNILREDYMSKEYKIDWESKYIYDNKGNIVIEKFRDYSLNYGEEDESGEFRFEYDERGNLIKATIQELVEGGIFVYNYKYDKNNNLSEWSSNGDKVELKYDDKGNVISVIGQLGYELVEYTFKYAYDGKGNWKTKYAYDGGKLVGKVTRVIWYNE